VKWNFL